MNVINSINNDEFYPTPRSIIDKMLSGIDFKMIDSVLEPSAGDGRIVEIIKEKINHANDRWNNDYKCDIDCIEIDTNLQYILKGKGFRIVHDDFLTYHTYKQYNLIVMNPPYSCGDQHLLKALQMQEQNGGIIVCLLNAETVKNTYTNSRKDLKQKLEKHSAKIEYIEDGFINAERQTDVEIALIRIDIPQHEKHSFIFEELRQEERTDYNEYTERDNNFLAQNDFIQSIVDQYNIEVKAGIRLINEWRAMKPSILKSFKNDSYNKDNPILELRINEHDSSSYLNNLSINGYIKLVRYKYWEALFSNDKFMGLLTSNLREDYYNKVKDLVDYDFSVYNIQTIKLQMNISMVKGVEETILALFDKFSSTHSYYDGGKNIWYYNGWKTNKAWKINKKVIVPSYFCKSNSYNSSAWDWNGYRPTNFNGGLEDIEKVFNYLDGGMTREVNLYHELHIAEVNGITNKIPLKFFNVSFYRKGTIHIQFINEQLLERFNIFGSRKKGWLPPSFGNKSYKDMNEEEKNVINEFCGEEKYANIVLNKDYYLAGFSNVLMIEEGEVA